MSFQAPMTIRKALERVSTHDYVLPAIQREFVWRPAQISRLFDSLMRGYPIGSFLFWHVDESHTKQFKFYDFVLNYHQRDNPHCPPVDLMGSKPVTAVLDGQQRLTALNIGLRGSHALKEPRKWWTSPDAFPTKRLYLNLRAEAEDNEDGMKYDFRFLKADRVTEAAADEFWFPVWTIMQFEDSGPSMFRYMQKHGLQEDHGAFDKLYALYDLVHNQLVINYFLEEEQDLDKVLNIFIRVNSGGTVLSYSDLLLSIATAQWDEIDARQAIHELVDDLNNTRDGFNISKDFVLKAGLMLSDIASVGFKVTNFNADNMAVLQSNWERISSALRTTIRLVADFGFNSQTLGAVSALLPIAYYVYQRELGESFLTAQKHQEDRRAIQLWLIRSLLKSGVWGSGLDTMLTALRTTIEEHGGSRFPVEEIESTMVRRGRSLRFEEDEIQDLVETSYRDRRAFAMLALLYPFVDLRNRFHVDHIFPQSRFTEKRLAKAGVPLEKIHGYREMYDRLPNLQLLNGTTNIEKTNRLPAEWLRKHFEDDTTREAYIERHDLGEVPADIVDFDRFYHARRERMTQRLRELLDVESPGIEVGPTPPAELPAADSKPTFDDPLVGRVFTSFLPSGEPDGPATLMGRVQDHLNVVRRDGASNTDVDVHTAEAIATNLMHLIEHLSGVGQEHLRYLHATVAYFVSDDDVIADGEVGGFDDDAEVLNAVADHFGRADLRVRLDIGY